jgi:uncharacterized protein (TIGR03067 family)
MNTSWMNPVAAFVCLSTCLAVAADQPSQVADLQGRWEVVELVEDGKVVPREAIREWLPSGGKLEIAENAVLFVSPGDGTKQVKLFSVDATQYPKRIDLESKEKKDAVGIYKLDEGKLILCLADPAEAERPAEFSSKEGSQRMLMVLERRASEAKPAAVTTARPEPPQEAPGTTGKVLTDAEVTRMLAGTWKYRDDVGALYVTFGADGTCSSVREVQQVRLFQKAFVRTPISSGRWSVRNGTLTLTITASIHPDRVNKQLPFSVRSISDRDFIFVDYLGRVGQATKVP